MYGSGIRTPCTFDDLGLLFPEEPPQLERAVDVGIVEAPLPRSRGKWEKPKALGSTVGPDDII